jgi:DNA-binding transcriptional MocR family regulator
MALTEVDHQVRAAIYRTLLEQGRGPSVASLASLLDVTESQVTASLRALAEAHAIVLRPGRDELWMAHPFSAMETDFVVSSGGRTWFANCVWDGLSILAMVGDGTLDTHSPATREPLRFEVRDRIVTGEGVVHFLVPAAHFWDDIGFT